MVTNQGIRKPGDEPDTWFSINDMTANQRIIQIKKFHITDICKYIDNLIQITHG